MLVLSLCVVLTLAADPTHFRNFLNNLRMTRGNKPASKLAFVELQVHHASVYAHNENAHAHDPYECAAAIRASFHALSLGPLLHFDPKG